MALDVEKVMAMRLENEDKNELELSKRKHGLQVKMFEDIEDGSSCRCPACMGMQYHSAGHKMITFKSTNE